MPPSKKKKRTGSQKRQRLSVQVDPKLKRLLEENKEKRGDLSKTLRKALLKGLQIDANRRDLESRLSFLEQMVDGWYQHTDNDYRRGYAGACTMAISSIQALLKPDDTNEHNRGWNFALESLQQSAEILHHEGLYINVLGFKQELDELKAHLRAIEAMRNKVEEI